VRPDLGDEEISSATRVLRSGWITQGPEVAAFEAEFASAVGAECAVAVSNCTVALELALRVLGVGHDDEVVTVSHTFIATPNAILHAGASPVFVDIEPDTFGMDPGRLEEALSPRTKAILCVHQFGIPCDLARILRIADERAIPVIEDAACAIGSEVRWQGGWERIGKPHGRMACFSFHPRKVVTTGDGGMITTSDAALAARLRLLRHHGMTVPDTERHTADRVVFEEYVEPGFNFRLTDLQAAVGRPQIARLAEIVARRRAIASRYMDALRGNRLLAPPIERAASRCNWQSFPTILREGTGVAQRDLMQFLLDRGVATKRGIANAHQERAYRGVSTWSCGPGGLPVSERMRDTTILLPLFHAMRDDEIDWVMEALRELDGSSSPQVA
jgi:dTDP-4-amino-4,6-dideoxygalactose transaminase